MGLTVALTPGEPAGIGPDLVVQLVQDRLPDARLIVIADPQLLSARAALLGRPLRIVDDPEAAGTPGTVAVWPVSVSRPVIAGTLDPDNVDYVLRTLERATDGCLRGEFGALVTGPVHKGVINDAGIAFSGHTEFLAQRAGAVPVMMLAAGSLRVALLTRHVPLREVAAQITAAGIRETVTILARALHSDFGIARPRLLVCGLNPHAGEGGHLGREEAEVIRPALDKLRAEGLELIGPVPADTAFIPSRLAKVDAVLAMYHDQGLPVLKARGFGRAVNITLGLPFVRTSVDHGTALELAGCGGADVGSLKVALTMAIELSTARAKT